MTVDIEELAQRVARLERRFDKEPTPSPQVQPLWVIDGLRTKMEDTDDAGMVVLGGCHSDMAQRRHWRL